MSDNKDEPSIELDGPPNLRPGPTEQGGHGGMATRKQKPGFAKRNRRTSSRRTEPLAAFDAAVPDRRLHPASTREIRGTGRPVPHQDSCGCCCCCESVAQLVYALLCNVTFNLIHTRVALHSIEQVTGTILYVTVSVSHPPITRSTAPAGRVGAARSSGPGNLTSTALVTAQRRWTYRAGRRVK